MCTHTKRLRIWSNLNEDAIIVDNDSDGKIMESDGLKMNRDQKEDSVEFEFRRSHSLKVALIGYGHLDF